MVNGTTFPANHLPTICFFGTQGTFSRTALAGLLAAGVSISAVVLDQRLGIHAPPIEPLTPPSAVSELPLMTPFATPSTSALAWEAGLDVVGMANAKAPASAEWLRTHSPDVVVVACFSQRIPAQLFTIPHHGFLNIHPSLLPELRGPTPLFWMAHLGREAGVSVHWMDAGFDTGPLAAQRSVTLPDGLTGEEADRHMAAVGADLVAELLPRLDALTPQPQPAGGSTFSRPRPADFVLNPRWSARHAFNFMRISAEFRQPYPIRLNEKVLRLREALAYQPDGHLTTPILYENDHTARIQFAPGILHARL